MKPEDKIAAFRKMAESDPTNELAHFSLGKLLVESGEHAEAESALRRSLELQPQQSVAYTFLGRALVGLGRDADAVEVWKDGYRLAAERGEFLPRDEMGKLLDERGAERPVIESAARETKERANLGADEVFCGRCRTPGARLPRAPFRSELGQQVHANVCQACWKEWMGVSVKLINEYRLNMATPEANETYDHHLREFFGLRAE